MDIIFLLITSVLSIVFSKQIRKYYMQILGFSLVISLLSYLVAPIDSLLNTGFIGLGLYLVVMFTTAFPKGSYLFKRSMLIRKELSIIGFILLLPHFLIYLIGDYQYWEWVGVVSALIMLPLFITSFTKVRKKFSHEEWLDIQYFAYHAYVLMFVHLFIVADNTNRLVYAFILIVYLFMKVVNDGFKRINSVIKVLLLIVTLNIGALIVYNEIAPQFETENTDQPIKPTEPTEPSQPTEPVEPTEPTEPTQNTYQDGSYEGSASGFRGRDVEVIITIENDEILSIEVVDCGCTAPHRNIDFEEAVSFVSSKIISENSIDVDIVTGATYSTNGLINAVEEALSKAKQP